MSKGRSLEGIKTIEDPTSLTDFVSSIGEVVGASLRKPSEEIQPRGSKDLFPAMGSLAIKTLGELGSIAITAAASVIPEEEKEKLANFATKVGKISKITSNIEQASEEYIPKIWDILSQGLTVLLAPLKNIISPIVDLLKNLGKSFMEGIHSIFSKPLEGQEKAYLNVTKNVDKWFEKVDEIMERPKKTLDNIITALDKPTKGVNNPVIANTINESNKGVTMVDRMKLHYPPVPNSSITPPSTPANKQGPSHTIQR